jgi:hypothetical protein
MREKLGLHLRVKNKPSSQDFALRIIEIFFRARFFGTIPRRPNYIFDVTPISSHRRRVVEWIVNTSLTPRSAQKTMIGRRSDWRIGFLASLVRCPAS